MTAQPTLFDEQSAHLARVSGALATVILRFCRARLATGQPEFHADELREYVQAAHDSAPGSADRILRALRREGRIAYAVVNRRESRYRLLAVN